MAGETIERAALDWLMGGLGFLSIALGFVVAANGQSPVADQAVAPHWFPVSAAGHGTSRWCMATDGAPRMTATPMTAGG